jgi:peroxiredoxin
MADLPKMAPTYAGLKKQGLQWIGVAINTSTDQAAQFTEQKGLPFINLVDPDKQVAMGLHTKLTPYTLLLDKHGKVAAVYQGAGKEILAAVKKDATDFLSTGQVKSAPVSSGHG